MALRFILLFFALLSFNPAISQTPQIIKVKKSDESFYFFQKGRSSDTISKNKGDLFYLTVNNKLKNRLIILVENGQLLKTENDSIFKLNYVKGIAYECMYIKISDQETTDKPLRAKETPKFEFKCLINGVATEEKNRIVFRFKIKNEAEPFLENKFFYKD